VGRCFPDERFQTNEGAKFWAKVLNDLKNRGVQDILIAVVDGLKGAPPVLAAIHPPDGLPPSADRQELPQAIEAAFPRHRSRPVWSTCSAIP
jgi:hypothetical protein